MILDHYALRWVAIFMVFFLFSYWNAVKISKRTKPWAATMWTWLTLIFMLATLGSFVYAMLSSPSSEGPNADNDQVFRYSQGQ